MEEILVDLNCVLESRQYSNSYYCRNLEQKIKEMYNVKHAITCSSCSQGLIMAVNYLRENLDCETIGLPSFTWISTLKAIQINNLDSKFVDIDKETWLATQKDIIDSKADAFLMVDTFGSKSDLEEEDMTMPLIYDCAQSLGVPDIGNRGLAEVFSLAPSKLFTAMEGGVITTNYDQVAEYIIDLRDKISRLEEINALIGLWHLNHMDEILKKKIETVEYYMKELPFKPQVISDTNYNVLGFLTDKSYEIMKELEDKVEFKKYYEPLSPLKNSQWVYNHILCIPSYYGVNYEQVVELIRGVV